MFEYAQRIFSAVVLLKGIVILAFNLDIQNSRCILDNDVIAFTQASSSMHEYSSFPGSISIKIMTEPFLFRKTAPIFGTGNPFFPSIFSMFSSSDSAILTTSE